jgi:ATP-binding cassette subfamily B protein
VIGSLATLAAIDIIMLLTPQVLRLGIDRGIEGGDLTALRNAALGLLGLTAVRGVLAFFQMRWIEMQSQGVAYDLRNAIHAKLAILSFSYHDRAQTGQLLSRAGQDVERLRFLTGRASLRLIEGILLIITTTLVLLAMNARLAMLVILILPLLVYRAVAFGRQVRPLSAKIQDQLGVLTTRLEQNLRGARIVKAFAQEQPEIIRFDEDNTRWLGLSQRLARIESSQAPLLTLIINIGSVGILWYGGLLTMRGQLTVGELVAFTTYLAQLANPIRLFGMITPVIGQAIASAERVFEILDARSEVQETPGAYLLPPATGDVRFEEVSFAYFGRHTVLDRVSFEAHPGQVIALLGATGSGKSTIINLIPRFYDVTGGRITVDGHDIRNVTLESLRSQIGIVLQETTLFIGTVRENIAFGKPDATQVEIEEAARAAQAHDFISAMPEGYDTRVGERGATVSGGQKQRIAIARALLLNPHILILDDSTSSVDAVTEHQIQQALDRLMNGRTSIVIAQRISTVRRADLILVLDRGRIAAQGTHDELMEESAIYAEIFSSQLVEDAPVA